ncbi:MAG: hypothetical protein J2P37_05080 [Ktedonobacteraceae bacterium]|nr:hypothetical protein [Ktedonobacteraceae bacterium]
MNIEGTYTLQAPAEHVWRNLMDPLVLRKSIPGIERLEQIDDKTYELALHIKNAPLRGTYCARINITEQQYPYHYRISIQGEGPQQQFSGDGAIQLQEREEKTVIVYQGQMQMDHPHLPATLAKGMLKLLVQQFFASLADLLYAKRYVTAGPGRDNGATTILEGQNGSIVLLPPPPLKEKGSILRRVIHRSGLGGGEQEEEERWEARIRRFGVIVGLLLLVWVGTRIIPRRH